MIGTFKFDDCWLIDPDFTIYSIGRDMSDANTIGEVLLHGLGVAPSEFAGEQDGANISILSDTEPEWTTEAVYLWVLNYLQQYKIA